MQINEILNILNNNQGSTTRLFFILRVLKEGISKSHKMLDKFDFKICKIDLSKELQNYLLDICINKIKNAVDKEYQLSLYDVMESEDNTVYEYKIQNKDLAFKKVLGKLEDPVRINSVSSLEEVSDNLWAYCIQYKKSNENLFFFRKIYKSKVGITREGTIGNRIRAIFDSSDSKLNILKGETISFDKNIDCIYHNNVFYVLNKNSFENIVSIQEDFKEIAGICVQELENGKRIEGLELLKEEISKNASLNKKLTKIVENGLHKNITPARIRAMQKIAVEFEEVLKVRNNKLVLEDNKDISLLLKLLDDYYLESMQSMGKYGSHNKRKLK